MAAKAGAVEMVNAGNTGTATKRNAGRAVSEESVSGLT